jgi:hypothetical protein
MYQQREDPAAMEVLGAWRPMALHADGELFEIEADESDAYVVIDELIGDGARIAVTAWPQIDEAGRLRFDEQGSAAVELEREELQAVLDARRSESGQLGRPARIGDAFLIRGFGHSAWEWELVIDVTGAARPAAKRAGLRAVAQPVPEFDLPPTPDEADAEVPPRGWRRLPPLSPRTTAEAQPPEQPSPGSATGAVI